LHKRLEHISLKSIEYLSKNTITSILDKKDINNARISLDNCIVYIQYKLTKVRNTTSSTKVNAYLDLLYIDIGRPIRPKTFKGYKYYITFRDSYTKYLEVRLLKSRKDIITIIKETIIGLELEAINNSSNINSINNIKEAIIGLELETINSSSNSNLNSNNFNNNKVKALQLDNEFISKELTSYLTSKGIKTRFFSPYTSK
jgi:hypothetical protein